MEQAHPLRSYRDSAGITLDQLAAEVGISKASLSRIECGLQEPSFKVIRKIIAATKGGVSAGDFTGYQRSVGASG